MIPDQKAVQNHGKRLGLRGGVSPQACGQESNQRDTPCQQGWQEALHVGRQTKWLPRPNGYRQMNPATVPKRTPYITPRNLSCRS